jgi:hypothetical protein
MKQILVLVLCLFAQYLHYGSDTGSYTIFLVECLYYEADTDSYIIFVGSILVLWVVDSMLIL